MAQLTETQSEGECDGRRSYLVKDECSHVYKAVWTPYIGQSLQLCCEDDNEHDDHAVCVRKVNGTVVWLAPREIFRTFWHFLRHGGRIECEITGRRKCGNGLEVPLQ